MYPNELTFALWLIVLLLIAIVWGTAWALHIHYDRYRARHAERRKVTPWKS